MSRRRPSFTPDPRVWSDFQCAARFGKGVDWFKAHLAGLEAEDFPKPDPLTGGRDAHAVEYWLDRRSGLATAMQLENPWDRAMGNGKD